ncbi:MAG TPA: divalent cation tolerance protein CutA [Candidatus Saccharimonadales bacterium]|nr:divalent cation tolerance protein CutA [Candidatus Saccharimonadales bacterium]
MDNLNLIELTLTCNSWQEAQKISDILLEKKLIGSVEFVEIKPKYWRQRQLDEAHNICLIMQSLNEYFDTIEAEVKEIYTNKMPILYATTMTQNSKDAVDLLLDKVR